MPRWGQAPAGKDRCKHIRRRLSVGTGRYEQTEPPCMQLGAGRSRHLPSLEPTGMNRDSGGCMYSRGRI